MATSSRSGARLSKNGRQANIANGPQQVNNGDGSRVREIETPQTKLLEAQHGERLDTRATSATSGHHPQVETVGAVNGAEDSGR